MYPKCAVLVSGNLRTHQKVQWSWLKHLEGSDFYVALYKHEKKHNYINKLSPTSITYYSFREKKRSDGMFHGMQKAWELFEKRRDEYDCVIRMRPDLLLNEDIRKWFTTKAISIPPPWMRTQNLKKIQDQLALGPPHLMEVYFKCYHTTKAGEPHSRLARALNKQKVPIVIKPMEYVIIRPGFSNNYKKAESQILRSKGKPGLWGGRIKNTTKMRKKLTKHL